MYRMIFKFIASRWKDNGFRTSGI